MKLRCILVPTWVVVSAIQLVVPSLLSADPHVPQWWIDRGVIDSGQAPSNYSPANLGQLKWMATQAKTELDARLPGGAGGTINSMVASFTSDPVTDFAPVNLGQLKAVAAPFYDRLNQEDYFTNTMLKMRGYDLAWSHDVPWLSGTPVEENYAIANLGQLKLVFSFDLVADFNESGTSDWDTMKQGGDPMAPWMPDIYGLYPGDDSYYPNDDPFASASQSLGFLQIYGPRH